MDFPELSAALMNLLGKFQFDLVQLEYTALGQYAGIIRSCAPQTAVVLEELDITYLALKRRLETIGDTANEDLQRQFSRMQRYERAQWKHFDAVVTMSEVERLEVAEYLDQSRVWVVPNGVDLSHFAFQARSVSGHPRVLFLGSLFHPPNHHGLSLFLREMWPGILKRNGFARLDVVGEGAGPELLCHSSESVVFHGLVPDVRPFLTEAVLLVVPIWTGSGTRLKVLEAFASGLPVVSTRFGCEGLRARAGEHYLLAQRPGEFVERIDQLFRQPELGWMIAVNARKLVEGSFGWGAVVKQAEAVWEAVSPRP